MILEFNLDTILLVNQVAKMLLCSHLVLVGAAGDLQEDLIRAGAALAAPEGAAEDRREREEAEGGRKEEQVGVERGRRKGE